MGQIKNIKLHIVTDIKTFLRHTHTVMAQGKHKLKNVHKKERNTKNSMGPSKGRKLIAPKKNKTIKEQKVKLQLTKAINNSIEAELATKAGSSGMHLIKAPPVDPKAVK